MHAAAAAAGDAREPADAMDAIASHPRDFYSLFVAVHYPQFALLSSRVVLCLEENHSNTMNAVIVYSHCDSLTAAVPPTLGHGVRLLVMPDETLHRQAERRSRRFHKPSGS
jgi:hypothetical protein